MNLKNNITLVWKSFELDTHYLLMVFFDVLFLLSAKLLFLLHQTGVRALSIYSEIIPLDKTTIATQSLESLLSIKTQIVWVIALVILLTVVFLLVLLALYSLANCVIWSIALKKKFTLKSSVRLFLLNLSWTIIWLLPFATIFLSIRPELVASLTQAVPWLSYVLFTVLGILLILHPLLFLQSLIFRYQKVWKTIGALFTTGYGRLSIHSINYVAGVLISILFAFVVLFVQKFIPMQAQFYLVLLAGLLLLNWFKLLFVRTEGEYNAE